MSRIRLLMCSLATVLLGGCPRNTPEETAIILGSLASPPPATAQALDCPGGVKRVAAVADGEDVGAGEVDGNCAFSLTVPAGRAFSLELRDGDGNRIAHLIEPNPLIVEPERLEQFIQRIRLGAGTSHDLGLLTLRGDMAIPQNPPLQRLDSDADGVVDAIDSDFDLLSLVTDEDVDSDGVVNGTDNCPFESNPGQEDADGNGVGDACEGRGSGPLHGRIEIVVYRNFTGDELQEIQNERASIEAAYPQANVTATGIEFDPVPFRGGVVRAGDAPIVIGMDGSFTIESVPPGTAAIQIFHTLDDAAAPAITLPLSRLATTPDAVIPVRLRVLNPPPCGMDDTALCPAADSGATARIRKEGARSQDGLNIEGDGDACHTDYNVFPCCLDYDGPIGDGTKKDPGAKKSAAYLGSTCQKYVLANCCVNETGDFAYRAFNLFGFQIYRPIACYPNHESRNCHWIDISEDGPGFYLSATRPGQTERPARYAGTPWPLPIPTQRGVQHEETIGVPCRGTRTLFLFNNLCENYSSVTLQGPGSLTPIGTLRHFDMPTVAGVNRRHVYLIELTYTAPDLPPGGMAEAVVVARSKGFTRRVKIRVNCPPLPSETGCGEPFLEAVSRINAEYVISRIESGAPTDLFPLSPNRLNNHGTAAISFGPLTGMPAVGGTAFNSVFQPLNTGAMSQHVLGINDHCAFCGEVSTSTGSQAFLRSPGGSPMLIDLLAGHTRARAIDISRTDVVVGTSFGAGTRSLGFFYRNGAANLLPTTAAPADARAAANGISDDGSAIAGSEDNQARVWSGMNFETILALPPLVPEGLAFANDVEGNNTVGGASTGPPSMFPFNYQPVVWRSGGAPVNLNSVGAEAGSASGVNSGGVIVGIVRLPGSVLAAFAHTELDGTVLLNDRVDPAAGIALLNATAINNRGQILCHAFAADLGRQLFVVLTPRD